MKAALRGFGGAVLALGLLGLAGCGTDNQSEAEKAQKNLGPIPATTGKVGGGDGKPSPATYDQRGAPDASGGDYGKRGSAKR